MFKDFFKGLAELLYPPMCPICERGLDEETLCGICYENYRYDNWSGCFKCGKITAEASAACSRCFGTSFDQVRYFSLYNGNIKTSIYKLKYNKEKWRAPILAFFLNQTFQRECSGWQVDGLIPVPLNKKREIDRGFNQSFLMAKKLSELTSIPVINDSIIRVKNTAFQARLTKEERAKNIKDAFKLGNISKINGRNLLLIDDIITSGTTLDFCARVLKKAGAKKVYGLTIASGE